MTIATVLGSFNILVGLMLVAACLLMGAGAVMWVTRLGTYNTYRDEAIGIMQWAVEILFVLIVLSIVVKQAVAHTQTVLFFLGVALVIAVILIGLNTYGKAHKTETEEEH